MRINQLFIAKFYNPNKPERGFTPGTRKKKRTQRCRDAKATQRKFVITLLILELTLLPQARAQTACQTKLTEAEQKIQAGAWNEAIHALHYGLETESCSLKEMEQIYVLLAQAYEAIGERDFAHASLRKLLKILPNWKPDPAVASPSFQSLAQEAVAEAQGEQERTAPSQNCKKWSWIAAGAAVVSGTIVYLFQ